MTTNLKVKLMSGEEFHVMVDLDASVTAAKAAVMLSQGYEEGTKLKLICDGKVLPEDKTLTEAGITATSFLVAFAKKPKKKKKVTPAPVAPVAPTPTPAVPTPTPVPATTTTTPAPSVTPNEPPSAPSAPQQPAQPTVDPATLQQVMEISGTDENTARSALVAAFGDAQRAIQYIFDPSSMPQQAPPQQQQQQQQQVTGTPSTTGANGGLEALRNHPTFPQLQRLIQSNPGQLPQVLQSIEQSNPQLFAVINSNPDGFVAMLNEPIAPTPAQPIGGAIGGAMGQQMGGMGGMGGMAQMMQGMGGGQGGMPNPAQLAQLINSLPQEARQGLAQQMGMTAEQLTAIGQQMSNMPPEQLQQMMQMQQMMQQGGGLGGTQGMMQGMGGPGGAPGQGGPQPGQIQINLTPEQRQDVDSLVNMGLGSQTECLQIYMACDKDVNQAASMLMDQAN